VVATVLSDLSLTMSDLGNYYAKMRRARPSTPAPLEAAKVRKEQANPTARDWPDRQGVRSLGKEPRIF
jgi:hypothetical protein